MLVTSLSGAVNATGLGSLDMPVQRIDRRRITLFNFSGTGTSPATDNDSAVTMAAQQIYTLLRYRAEADLGHGARPRRISSACSHSYHLLAFPRFL